MNWTIGALKILARNPTVPGVALRDAVKEIERLRAALKLALEPTTPSDLKLAQAVLDDIKMEE